MVSAGYGRVMELSFDTGVQVIGAAAGVLATYYAYRQFRLSLANQQQQSGPGDRQGFTCKGYNNPMMIGVAVMVGAIGVYVIIGLAPDRGTPTADLLLGMGVMFLAAFFYDWETAPYRVELDEQAFTVKRSYRQPKAWQISWDRIDHIAIRCNYSDQRLVVAILPEGGGFAPGIPQSRYAADYGGYVMCELRETEPSEEAFIAALRLRSGKEVAR